MRLLSLSLEGFMPYRKHQTLDFRDQSIFALVGATGSGKSSLLDAITFAFFGKTPRWGDGRPGAELITQGEKKLTVEVQFHLKGEQYRVLRSARRSGSPEAQLERWDQDRYKPLSKERQTQKTVNQAIVTLLGMDYATFTRTLMLPQGQFDRLLKPENPRERKELLIKLAGLELYDALRERLKQRQAPLEEQLKLLQGQLRSLQQSDDGQLPLWQAEEQQLQVRLPELKQELEHLSLRLQQLRQDLELDQNLQKAQSELQRFDQQAPAMQEKQQRLQRSRQLEGLRLPLQMLEQQRRLWQQHKGRLDQQNQERQLAQQRLQQAQVALEQAQEKAQQLPGLQQAQEELIRLEAILPNFRVRSQEEAQASSLLESLQRQLHQLEQQLTRAREQAPLLESQQATCQQELESLGQAQPSEVVARWQAALDLRRQVAQAQAQCQQAELKLRHNQEQQGRLQPELAAAEQHLDNLQAQWTAQEQELTLQGLRQQLQSDCPCPLCLQPLSQLPLPPTLFSETPRLADDLQQAQQQQQSLRRDLLVLQGQLVLLQEQAQQAQQQREFCLGEFQQRFGALLDLEELQQRLSQAQSDEKQRQALEKKLQQLRQELSQVSNLLDREGAQQQQMQQRYQEELARQQQLRDLQESLRTQLIQALGPVADFEKTLRQRRQEIRSQFEGLQQTLTLADKEQQQQQQALQSLDQQLESTRQLLEQAKTEGETLQQELLSGLGPASLADEAALRQALLSSEVLQSLEQELEDYQRRRQALQLQVEQWIQQLQDRRPDPEQLQQACQQEAQWRLEQTQGQMRLGVLSEKIAQRQRELEQLEQLQSQADQGERSLGLYKKLAKMLDASGLKAFVASRLLEEVLALASSQLEQLSGRYQLRLDSDESLMVVDNWNAGEARDVRSLSGGETFLASLSLALAMVEYLSQGAPLESLFIDEGFGTLDLETLEAVAQTLEALQEKGRLVGVITHVPELAERLPQQIRVENRQGSSEVKWVS